MLRESPSSVSGSETRDNTVPVSSPPVSSPPVSSSPVSSSPVSSSPVSSSLVSSSLGSGHQVSTAAVSSPPVPSPYVESAPASRAPLPDPTDPTDPSAFDDAAEGAGSTLGTGDPAVSADHPSRTVAPFVPDSASPDRTSPDDLEALGERIAELSALISAASFHLLTLIREFDERGGWNCGFASCAHWLSWRTGLSLGPAREKVRVARSLGKLPRISEACREGRLSYSKVRALTRVATADNEERLIRFARAGTATHVERLVRAWRGADREEEARREARRHAHRHLEIRTDPDGSVVVRGRLDPEAGAALRKALEAAEDVLYGEAAERTAAAVETTPAQRRADAIGRVAEAALAGGLDRGTRGDRYQVMLHADAESLAEEDAPVPVATGAANVTGGSAAAGSPKPAEPRSRPFGPGLHHQRAPRRLGPGELSRIEGAGDVPAGTSRRIACDAARIELKHAADGRILDVGRRTRAISPALRRALEHRDGGCRFPGCASRYCDAHHVEHWANGGETKLDNLVLLCRRHHRSVHEEGYAVALDAAGHALFSDPRGRPIDDAPRPPGPAARTPDPLAAPSTLTTWLADAGSTTDPTPRYPEWDGSALDLDMAIEALWSPAR